MCFIAESSEQEMVAVFLQGELQSARWRDQLLALLARDQQPLSIVAQPNLACEAENSYRMRLLGDYRGYRQKRALFEDFPDKVHWQHVGLTRSELFQAKYIDYDYWMQLSQGTRLAPDAAKTINAGKRIFQVPNDDFQRLAQELRAGAAVPEIILVRSGEGAGLVVLEGHVRLTAYALAPEAVPAELRVLLGTAPEFVSW